MRDADDRRCTGETKQRTIIHRPRHYTRNGLLKPSRDLRNGYKIYKPSDKDRLKFIVAAKNRGFTLAEIEKILGQAVHGDSRCPMVREIVEKRIEENKEKMRELKRLQRRLREPSRCGKNDELGSGRTFGMSPDRVVLGPRKLNLT